MSAFTLRMKEAHAWLLFGGQFGSEGKGKAAAYMAFRYKPQVAVCAFSANAGHIAHFPAPESGKFTTHTLPQAAMAPSTEKLYIGPGAAINLDRLFDEMAELGRKPEEVLIDYRALVIQPKQVAQEAGDMVAISSTCQGVGQAYADRTLRKGGAVMARDVALLKNQLVDVSGELERDYREGKRIQIEGCQGWELDVLHGYSYPYCTSRSTGSMAVANDCGFPYTKVDEVIAVCRTYPIRVGNSLGDDGSTIGYSGPVHPDSKELSWDEITSVSGSPEPLLERTTVTKKVRRIFTWSTESFKRMLWMNSVTGVWLNFADYVDYALHGENGPLSYALRNESLREFLEYNGVSKLAAIGTGPKHEDVCI